MIKKLLLHFIRLIPNSKRISFYRLIESTIVSPLNVKYSNPFPSKNMFKHIELMKDIGFNPNFIIDVGAYVGDWTKEVCKIYPESKYLMIEAQESKRDILDTLSKSFDNITYKIVLLGEEEKGNVRFFEMETGSSMYEENTNHKREVRYLNMYTLDSVVSENCLAGKGFIKLDIQGAEIDVLKGALETLKMTEFILIEVSTLNYNEKAPLFADVVVYLNQIGFSLFDICDERRTAINVLFQLDLLFIKRGSKYHNKVSFNNQ